jgi:hypothetical protein
MSFYLDRLNQPEPTTFVILPILGVAFLSQSSSSLISKTYCHTKKKRSQGNVT